ncbi:glycosyltransferase [Lentiprolixibacter aurantiacus]|uniref:Glycosyltransferase n=1 Tax=Lentiprolixibacter aurantiacus TaxID=2993939 RepID=A0AAE3MKP8_9FLAO|nr:glycosyltransferase [Lentiprolixibacter aurantiacus]MCX2719590.1 glycosyltransferase [Lentiprolixibacter aurantiacus]
MPPGCNEDMGRQKLLIIGHSWPEPKATAAGVRMMQLIDYFLELKWELTFACTSAKSDKAADLNALGVSFVPIGLNDEQFDVFLKNLNPDVALFDRYITEEQFGWRVAETLPHCVRVLDTEDLHSLRIAREKAVKADRAFALADWFKLDQTKRELASIYRCDLSLIISEVEMQLLQEQAGVPSELLLYLPFWINRERQSAVERPGYASRQGFMFIGNGRHQPNTDAIAYLKGNIWPIIRELMPFAHIDIYGAYLPDKILALHQPKEGFLVKGYVEDANRAMQQVRVNLVPLRYGAGLKGKLLLALENGTPSVSTTAGVEGYWDPNDAPGFTFDEPREFAKEAVRLYTNESDWTSKQLEGDKLLVRKFRGDSLRMELSKTLKNLINQLEAHRLRNILGAMLHHHSMQSTKYLSKWITLKNQLKSQHPGT